MKAIPLLVLAALALSACGNPTAEQAASDPRERPNRADQMMAFNFAPGSARLDSSQEDQVLALVAEPHGRRDEFLVVTDGMPELAAEFEMTAIELTYLPDRQQALENMTERSDSPAVAALVNALRQTEKYGTPLAASLRILSQEFRQTRASKAEEKGARMPALMTVPLMVFILPTLITVLIAPAIMSAMALT